MKTVLQSGMAAGEGDTGGLPAPGGYPAGADFAGEAGQDGSDGDDLRTLLWERAGIVRRTGIAASNRSCRRSSSVRRSRRPRRSLPAIRACTRSSWYTLRIWRAERYTSRHETSRTAHSSPCNTCSHSSRQLSSRSGSGCCPGGSGGRPALLSAASARTESSTGHRSFPHRSGSVSTWHHSAPFLISVH